MSREQGGPNELDPALQNAAAVGLIGDGTRTHIPSLPAPVPSIRLLGLVQSEKEERVL